MICIYRDCSRGSLGCHVLLTPTATYIITVPSSRVTINKIRWPAGASCYPTAITKISPIKRQKPHSQDIIFGRIKAQNVGGGPNVLLATRGGGMYRVTSVNARNPDPIAHQVIIVGLCKRLS